MKVLLNANATILLIPDWWEWFVSASSSTAEPRAYAYANAINHTTEKIISFRVSLIEHHFQHNLTSRHLRMAHSQLQRSLFNGGTISPISTRCYLTRRCPGPKRIGSIIQTPDISPGDDLSQPPILRISHLDEIAVEENKIRAVHSCSLSFADELHDDGTGHFAVFINVDTAFFVAEKELRIGEPEHTEWFLALETIGDVAYLWVLSVGDTHWDFLIQSHKLETSEGGDGNISVEEIYGEAFGWDVELVEFTEEFCRTAEFLAE